MSGMIIKPVPPPKPWVFWAILYGTGVTSLFTAFVGMVVSAQMLLVKSQSEELKAQNIRSLEDRSYIHQEIEKLHATTNRADARSEWLEGVVKKAIESDRVRHESREKAK